MRVLIGDDNERIANSLARALRPRGLEADLADTPQEVIAKAGAGNYSAVITDLEYTPEGREGFEVLRAIKDLPALKILYTGRNGFEVEAEALVEGADYAVLNKDYDRLFEILQENIFGDRK